MKSISARLDALEHRPESMIPAFLVEFLDGHTEMVYGGAIIRYHDGVRRIVYDGRHQGAVDGAALYAALNPDIDLLARNAKKGMII